MRTSYAITVRTNEEYSNYKEECDTLVDITKEIFSDLGIDDLTKYTERTDCAVSVELEAEDSCIVMKGIIDIDAD